MYDDQLNISKVPAGYSGQAATQENPLMSLMREYVQAKTAFDDACRSFAECQQQRGIAEKRLHELSEKVANVVAQGVYDPTAPQPAMPNGLTGGGLKQSHY